LLHRTNQLADDVQQKSQSLNSVFEAVDGFGQSLNAVNTSVRNVTQSVEQSGKTYSGKVAQILQWGRAAIDLIQRWKHGKNADK
jgi:uncharacterized protein YoxC